VAAPEEAIYITMRTLLAPGDEVVAITPAYQSLYEVAGAIGCKVMPWQVALGPDGWKLDLEALKNKLTRRTRLLVINFPHNPTGCLASRAEFERILELSREHGLYLFSDEMYRLLEYDPGERLPPACDEYANAISLGGLSKSLALPGLRIGWLATREQGLLERIQAYKDYTTICSSAPSEVLGIIALHNQAAIVKRNLSIIQENLAAARAFCERHTDRLRWLEPWAGSVAFPQWLGEQRVESVCQRALDKQGVMVVPGSMFDYPGGHFRVGLGRRNFPQALERFEAVLAGGPP
jgi:aspartate/methionine/tyrosine aminotransferase